MSDAAAIDPFTDEYGVHIITADELREGRKNTNLYAKGDSGAIFDTFTSNGNVYAEGSNTGALMRLVRSGSKVDKDGMVRVKMQIAEDLGDQDGTLGFSDQSMFRGSAPASLFE